MRPMSVNSDLREAIATACLDAINAGLEPDQIVSIVRSELDAFKQAADAGTLDEHLIV